MGARRIGRELAVQALYQMDLTGHDLGSESLFWEHFDREGADARRFAEELVQGVGADRERLDALIQSAAEHWRVERLSVVDRCVLRVAAHELAAHPETPVSVALDEAVEVARRFGGEGSAAFVNGVLQAVAGVVRPTGIDEERGERG